MISNNIANVGTMGFKGERMTFADMFYQSQNGYATAPTKQRGGVNPQEIGLGVKVNTIDTNFSQGGLQTTGLNTDLAINGDGFFMMRNVDGSGQPIYTRDGAFSLNSNGVLYDPATGLAVQGYMADSSGKIGGGLGAITVPIGLSMQATGTGSANAVKLGPSNDNNFDVTLGGSLDANQYSSAVAGSGVTPKTISTTIYDSLGNAHQATITLTPAVMASPAPTVNNPNGTGVQAATCFQYTVSFADGTTASAASTGYAFFDANGQFINTSSSLTGTPVHAAGTAPSTADGNAIQITGWPAGDNSTLATIGLDFSNVSALAGTATASVTAQDGYPAGTLSNITIGQDGIVTGSFTNGQQKTVAQVALATFQNEGGLHRVGGGFQQTANSGVAQVGIGTTGRFGAIVSGALEESNVSLADEFTKMIVAQRAFEANTRGISTADQNLQTVINIRGSEN
jgi:flagellar hook protein FlgE